MSLAAIGDRRAAQRFVRGQGDRRGRESRLPPAASAAGSLAEQTDAELVRRAKAGEQIAFGELVRRYQDKIYTIVHSQVRDAEEALDLTQDVFVKAYRKLPDFREDSVFYTWIYRVAINRCIDLARKQKRTPV